MDINNALTPDALNKNPHFGNDLFQKAQAKVTFWGTRMVTWETGESFPLNDLVNHLYQASNKRFEERFHSYTKRTSEDGTVITHTMQERIAGFNALDKVRSFYEDSSKQIRHANWITRVFAWINDWRSSTSNLYQRLSNFKDLFRRCNHQEFEANFKQKLPNGQLPVRIREDDPYFAPEEWIREKAHASHNPF